MLNPHLIVPGPTEEPVSVKGNTVDRGEFEKMRREYYELREWDPATGLQTPRVFDRLDMPEVGKMLDGLGLLSADR
jgi:aldehyde:ferredoxin oxidoreductase